MGSLNSPCTTFYRSSIETMTLNCLVFKKIAFLCFGDRQTDEQMDSTAALAVASGGLIKLCIQLQLPGNTAGEVLFLVACL